MRCVFVLAVLAVLAVPLVAADWEVLQVIQLSRHGDRGPIRLFPLFFNQSSLWPLGLEQLTAQGMNQTSRVGMSTRARYMTDLNFLSPQWDYQHFFARASPIDRCLMSCQSIIYGLYPLGTGPANGDPQRFQPVPIYTVPLSEAIMLRPWTLCPRWQQVLDTVVYQTPEFKQKEAENADLFEEISRAIGAPVKLSEIYVVYDAFATSIAHNYPLPVSPDKVQKFMEVSQWAIYQTYASEPVLPLLTSNFFAEVTKLLTEENSNGNFHMFAAHDTTVLPMGGALGVIDKDVVPPYASALTIEEIMDTTTRAVYVQVFYNGYDKGPVPLPWCQGRTQCPLHEFLDFLQKYTMPDWNSVCDYQQPPKEDSNSLTTLNIILISVSSVLAAASIILLIITIVLARRKSGYKGINSGMEYPQTV